MCHAAVLDTPPTANPRIRDHHWSRASCVSESDDYYDSGAFLEDEDAVRPALRGRLPPKSNRRIAAKGCLLLVCPSILAAIVAVLMLR